MKKFLTKISIYLCILITICSFILLISNYIINKSNFSIPKDKHILILGDSHTECAINDAIFTQACNLSQSGIGYLYSFSVLKKILESNQQIDTVWLSFFDKSLTKSYDSILYSQERTKFKLPKSYYLL